MNRILALILATFAACQLAGCSVETPPGPEEDAITAQLLEIAAMSRSALPTTEMTDRYLHYFAAEPTLLPADRAAIIGRDAIADFYNGVFKDIEILDNEYREPVVVVRGDTATRRYLGTAVFRVPGEEAPVTATNRYLDLLVKENGEWKMLWHAWVPVTWQ